MLKSYQAIFHRKTMFYPVLCFFITLTPFIVKGQSYCTPTWEYSVGGNTITQVIFGDINNPSPFQVGTTPEYEDFTSLSTTVEAGETYPVSIKGPSSTFESDVVVFIDFNQNGSFNDAGESFYIGRLPDTNPANAHTITGSIAIPSGATAGTTRMRILKNTNVASYSDPNAPNTITDACGYYRSGQAEDYTVVVNAAPTASVYCTPTYSGWAVNEPAEPITLVQFGVAEGAPGAIDNASVNEVSTTTPRYEDFSSISMDVVKGETYTLLVKANTNGNNTNYITVYFDWNGDGTFSNSTPADAAAQQQLTNQPEKHQHTTAIIDSDGADGQQMIHMVTIPTDAVTGQIGMRIVKNLNAPSPAPCSNPFFPRGQVEDYTLNISESSSSDEYCDVTAEWDIEPITLVNFADLDNPTSAVINGTPAYEDFTSMTANVEQGETYTITVKGNTAGDFEHDIRVFIDWDQDLVFNMGTEFYTASLLPSTGEDNVQATIDITVPAGAVLGNTRMRIIKDMWNVYEEGEFDACTDAYYGQVEDYTVHISEATPVVIETVTVSTANNVPAEITTENGTLQLIAAITPAEANQDVVWTVESGNTIVSVEQDGLVTAIANGTATVKATSAEDNTKYDEIIITVSYTTIIDVETIVVSVFNDDAPVVTTHNGTLQLIAAVHPSGANQDVVWTVESGSGIVSVDANGLVTAITNGTTTVRATSVSDNTKYDEIEITVNIQYVGLETLENQLSVSPNPATDFITVSLNKHAAAVTVKVIDLSGKQVSEASYTNTDSFQIDCSGLSAGMYQLIIRTDDHLITEKIYKK